MTALKYNLLLEPDDHQWVGIKRLEDNKHYIIGDDMGVGKTLQAIAILSKYYLKTVVICPAIAKRNWEREVHRSVRWNASVCVDTFDPSKDVFITNYERLEDCEEAFKWAEYIIFDEAHYLKTVDSGRSSIAQWYVAEKENLQYLALLTGTPIKNRVHEFFPLLRLISFHTDPEFMKTYKNLNCFIHRFCKVAGKRIKTRRGYIYQRKVTGTKNRILLADLLKTKMIRRDKSVLKLQKPRDVFFRVQDSGNPQLLAAFEAFQNGEKSAFVSSVKKQSAIEKAPFTVEYVNSLVESGHGPVVVFSDHIDSAELIYKGLKKKGLRVGLIYGEVNERIRDTLITQFQNGELDALIATIGTMSTAITLTKAHQMVFNDLAWVPSDNAQAKGRIIRRGQLLACVIHYMTGSYMDETISETLVSKETDITAVYSSITED